MSDNARIAIIGKSRESLLKEIERIKEWDNGHDYPIYVTAGTGKEKTDSIENVENAIKNDLAGYIEKNFGSNRTILKSGGNDDLFLVPDPDSYVQGKFRKIRRGHTNYTPPKKRRKRR